MFTNEVSPSLSDPPLLTTIAFPSSSSSESEPITLGRARRGRRRTVAAGDGKLLSLSLLLLLLPPPTDSRCSLGGGSGRFGAGTFGLFLSLLRELDLAPVFRIPLTLCGSGSSFLSECGSGSSFENEGGSMRIRIQIRGHKTNILEMKN
jgi:hypothetical protein